MKKNALFALFLFVLTLTGLNLGNAGASFVTVDLADNPSDEGGEWFSSEDPCGYVMGSADPYFDGTVYGSVAFTPVDNENAAPDRNQGCADENGYFYSSSSRESHFLYEYDSGGSSAATFTVDLDYYDGVMGCGNLGNESCEAAIDQTTGLWSGYARIIDGGVPDGKRDIWFGFVCAQTATPATCASIGSVDKVTTNLTTGATTGYAWNDYFGYMLFDGLTWELPPENVDMWVSIVSSNGDGPEAVDNHSAPIADGEDFWTIQVQFTDAAGNYLTEADVASVTITPNESADSQIYLNQVEHTGADDAVLETNITYSSDFPDCTSGDTCVRTEPSNGGLSWNTFVKSAAPTSNMLYYYDDTAFWSDRDGCRWVYRDQWSEEDGKPSQVPCPGVASVPYEKSTYFQDRVSDRNQYILESVTVDVSFVKLNTYVNTGAYTEFVYSDKYAYTPHDSYGNAGLPLSFRPRYQAGLFTAFYDDAFHDQISADPSKQMRLHTEADVSATSQAFQDRYALAYPAYEVKYQLDADSNCSMGACPYSSNNLALVLDTMDDVLSPDPDMDPDCARRTDAIPDGSNGARYVADYPMGYAQKDEACTGVFITLGTTNTLSNPTAEQWVCDYLRESALANPQLSCYYTGYLPRIDRHADAEDMVVLGAINSAIDAEAFLDNDSTLSRLGTGDLSKLRNKMVALLGRYIVGKGTPTGGILGADSFAPSSGMLKLLGGRLVYAEGDVFIEGGDNVPSMTLVTKGNVIIKGNITGGHMGIMALRDEDGQEGNVYVAPWVTDVHANIFADGAFLPFDGFTVPDGAFDWDAIGGDETRYDTLKNQFYLNGSLVANGNTINGADPSTAPGSSTAATSWQRGDGTTTTDYNEAREYDLNLFRQYRLCYQLTDGIPDESLPLVDCEEGALLSGSEASDSFAALDQYPPFILDYSPADDLPIFRAESGLFQ